MNRSIESDEVSGGNKTKKIKPSEEGRGEEEDQDKAVEEAEKPDSVLMDENLLYEVMKHADARTLATAACVSKHWHKTTQDERLWELICTRHWTSVGCGNQQLRSVVLALGGFRRLHSQYLLPLSKPSSSASSLFSAWPGLPPPLPTAISADSGYKTRWGRDEVQLSLSLLSIRYYEKMNLNKRGK